MFNYFVIFITLLLTSNLYAQKVIFYKDGVKVTSVQVESFVKKFPVKKVSIYHTNLKRNLTYKTISFQSVLSKVYKKCWTDKSFVEFYTKTRYRPQLPISYAKYRTPYLAFDKADGLSFQEIDPVKNRIVELGPLYFIWEKNSKLNYYEKRQFRHVYQIIGINLITEKKESSDKGKRLYDRFCLRCHAVKGHGGGIAVSLESSHIIKRWGRDKVVNYIMNPKQINPNSHMPEFNYVRKESAFSAVGEIVDYIEKIASGPKKKKRESKAQKLMNVFD